MPASGNNPIAEPVFAVFAKFTALRGFLNLLGNQLDNFRGSFQSAFEEHGLDISKAFAGFALLVRDLTVPQEQKYMSYIRGGLFTRKGEDYLEAANELITQWSHWSVAQCYEAFETYLREMAALYYFHSRPTASTGRLKYVPIAADDTEAWREMFHQRDWHSFSLLEQLRVSCPSIGNYEKHNILRIDLSDWHSLLAAVRHGVTHSASSIPRQQIRAPAEAVENLLPSAFPGTWQGDFYVLEMSKDSAEQVISVSADYSFLIFKCLCIKEGYEWEVVEPINAQSSA